jgi:hypothetical protein
MTGKQIRGRLTFGLREAVVIAVLGMLTAIAATFHYS